MPTLKVFNFNKQVVGTLSFGFDTPVSINTDEPALKMLLIRLRDKDFLGISNGNNNWRTLSTVTREELDGKLFHHHYYLEGGWLDK